MFAVPAGILATESPPRSARAPQIVVTWNTVARVPLFAGLDATGIAAIARLLKPQIAPAHYAIVRRGEPATAMFFIMSGEVEVDVQPTPRCICAAASSSARSPCSRTVLRTATVSAVTEVQLLTLGGRRFPAA